MHPQCTKVFFCFVVMATEQLPPPLGGVTHLVTVLSSRHLLGDNLQNRPEKPVAFEPMFINETGDPLISPRGCHVLKPTHRLPLGLIGRRFAGGLAKIV
jgi:hypothetical protein